LAKKLRLQNANRALILNAPEGYLDLLGELPEEIKIEGELFGKYDFAHLFVKERAELEQFMDQVLQVIEYDVILWISYPKGGSGVKTDLNRDKLWKALAEKGIRPVMQVSIDEVWSAMRFRPTEQVGG
jgi:DNA-binding phage protein